MYGQLRTVDTRSVSIDQTRKQTRKQTRLVAKCGRVCRAQTCAPSGIEPSTFAKGFLQGGPKVRQNFEFLIISKLYVPYISATAKNRGLQATYVAF